MPVNKNLEITDGALLQETNQILTIPRRSNRKRRIIIPSTQTFAKKSKKSSSSSVSPSPVSVPTLITLPFVVTRKLLLYFDVETLENLGNTCSYFDQFISGRFITSLDFPLPPSFITEVATTRRLEKKPILKIRCKKTDKMLFKPRSSSYMFHSQLSLLSLDKVREIDFVPASLKMGNKFWPVTWTNYSYEYFDLSLLRHVKRMGSLDHVTRLSILLNGTIWTQWHGFLSMFPSLVELGLTISEPYMCMAYYNSFLQCLKKVVAASKAPVLKLCLVKSPSRRMEKRKKVLKNSFVEKLVVEGPCTMNLVPVMENLKVVEVKLDSSPNSCTYWRSKLNDRTLHRDGLCCVNIGKMFNRCPNLEKFMGMEVEPITKTPFNKWSLALKKKFYEKYLHQGGTKEFKAWGRTRWFTRKQVLYPVEN